MMQIFALVAGTNDATVKLFVVNAHLTAGPSADRRLRQVHEALETVEKDRGGVVTTMWVHWENWGRNFKTKTHWVLLTSWGVFKIKNMTMKRISFMMKQVMRNMVIVVILLYEVMMLEATRFVVASFQNIQLFTTRKLRNFKWIQLMLLLCASASETTLQVLRNKP